MDRESSALPSLEPPSPWVALWSTVKSDRWVQLMLAAFAATAALYLLPVLSEAQRASLSRVLGPFLFLSLVVTALAKGLDRVRAEERRFWWDVTAAFLAWLAVSFLYLFFPQDDRPLALGLVVEALYAGYYVALILAAERHPHRVHRWRALDLERALTWPAVTAVILGLFGYFFVIPILLGGGQWSPSYAVYLTLDAYLTARFLFLSRTCGSPRWRTLYLVLGSTTGIVFLNELLEATVYSHAPARWGAALDLVYYLPYLAIVLARVRHFPFPEAKSPTSAGELPESSNPSPSARTMLYALAFPVIHLGGYQFGLLEAASKPAREALVFWVLLLLGLVAVIQHHLFARRLRELWLDREKMELSLRNSEKDLRLMVERYHSDEKVRLSEEKLAKAFRVSPDGMAISSLANGRLVDVNDNFERITGHRREELLGRTAAELDLWAEPEERKRMVQILEREEQFRGLEARFRAKGGEIVTVVISAERLLIDGEPCVLSVIHAVTEHERLEVEPAGADTASD